MSASYTILDDPDQNSDERERYGDLVEGIDYVFRDGKLMARVDGRWSDWEAEEF